ncbi:hypothetical protein [Williamsia sp. M5A3_1d]
MKRGLSWEPTASRVLGVDLAAAPRFFDRAVLYRDPAHSSEEVDAPVGVLVEFDLGDVPPEQPRPLVIPCDVSAHGTVVWVLDRELPVAMRIDGDRIATEHLLPAPVEYSWRKVLATPGGCWVIGSIGVIRCAPGDRPRLVEPGAVSAGAVSGDRLLACRADGSWMLHEWDGPSILVERPHGHVSSAVGDRDGFLVAVVTTFSDEDLRTVFRLVRVSLNGATIFGPTCLSEEGEVERPVLGGNPTSLIVGGRLYAIDDDLQTEPVHDWPSMRFGGGSAGRYLWTVTHPTDRPGCVGTWAAPGRDADPVPRQYWMLNIFDGATGETLQSIPVFVSQPSVAVDVRGAVWIVADGLRVLSTGSTALPELVDFAELSGSHEEVASGRDDEVGQFGDQR